MVRDIALAAQSTLCRTHPQQCAVPAVQASQDHPSAAGTCHWSCPHSTSWAAGGSSAVREPETGIRVKDLHQKPALA